MADPSSFVRSSSHTSFDTHSLPRRPQKGRVSALEDDPTKVQCYHNASLQSYQLYRLLENKFSNIIHNNSSWSFYFHYSVHLHDLCLATTTILPLLYIYIYIYFQTVRFVNVQRQLSTSCTTKHKCTGIQSIVHRLDLVH